MFWKSRLLTPIDPYKGSALVELNFFTKNIWYKAILYKTGETITIKTQSSILSYGSGKKLVLNVSVMINKIIKTKSKKEV